MPSLTDHTSRGFAWMALQAASAKVTSLLGQVALAYLLIPEHFGLAALANIVYNFAAILQQAGIRQVLVSRGRSYHLWAGPALWMSFVLGLIAALGMCAFAPLMASAYDEPLLTWLIIVMSPCLLIDAFVAIPTAKAQIDLRFKLIAFANWAAAIAQTATCVLFAFLGFGAMAFALSVIAQIITRAIILFTYIPFPRRPRPRLTRWKYLLGNSSWLFAATIVLCAANAVPALLLGQVFSAEAVGLFSFALGLSLQSVQLITIQLEGVLFATLSRLRDETLRQARAFLRATGVLALVAMPLCLLQAALADPGIRIVFHPKWYDAILPTQLLSIAMAFFATTYSVISLVNAQGRFRTYFKLTLFSFITTFLLIALTLLALFHQPDQWHAWVNSPTTPRRGPVLLAALGATAAAAALALQLILYSIISLRAAIRPPALKSSPDCPTWADIFRTLFLPFFTAAAAIAPAWAIAQLLPNSSIPLLLTQAALTTFIAAALYLLLAPRLLSTPWHELLQRLDPLLKRLPPARALLHTLSPRPTSPNDKPSDTPLGLDQHS